jgi:hypothetical protein
MARIRYNREPNTLFWVGRCPDIKVPIISISHDIPRTGVQVALDGTWGSTDEEKLTKYEFNAQDLIRAGRFSRVSEVNDIRWAGFTNQDKEFIHSIIKKYEEESGSSNPPSSDSDR